VSFSLKEVSYVELDPICVDVMAVSILYDFAASSTFSFRRLP
jgi:hypothetical protein